MISPFRRLAISIGGGGGATKPDGAPSNLVLTVINDTSIKLDWTRGSTNNDGTKIYNSLGILVETVVGTDVAKTLTGLSQTTLYQYYIKEYKGSAESAASNTATGVTHATALYDSNTNIWLDYLALTTLTKDVNEKISEWRDRLGSATKVAQATGSKQPTYTDDGVLFPGDGKYLKGVFTQIQPTQVYIAVKVLTWSQHMIYDGATTNSMLLYGGSSAVNMVLPKAGVAGTERLLTLNDWHIVNVAYNGASSIWQIDDNGADSENLGTSNSGGLTLGSNGPGIDVGMNVVIKEIICRKVADSVGSKAAIINYLSQKYGFFF